MTAGSAPETAGTWTEAERVAALRRYGVLDTPREAAFDDIAEMAAKACGTPIALIDFIDADRHWFKAEVGLGLRTVPLASEPSWRALAGTDLLEVPDLLEMSDLPGSAAHPPAAVAQARFYAGVPLLTPEGLPVGVLCVMDRVPGRLAEPQGFILRALARAVMDRLEQGRAIAERDAALARQRRAESRSRLMLDSAVDYGIISFDLAGAVTSWNEGAHRILGWSEAEMIGRHADRIFTPEDVAVGLPAAEMEEALATGRGRDERWHVRKSGDRFWADGEVMALRDDGGAVTGFVKIMRDRTEEHVALRALRDNQERIETALDTGLLGFFDWDVALQLIRGDRSFAAFHGLDPERLADGGVPLDEVAAVIHQDDRAAVAASVGSAMAASGSYSKQFRTLKPDGTLRHLMVRGHCYERDGDRALRYTGVAVDVTASKAAEEVSRQNQARYRSLFSSIDAGFCIIAMKFDGEGRAVDYRFVEVNPAFERQTGIVDALGRWMRDLVPDHDQHWFDLYGRVALTGAPLRTEQEAEALGRWYDVHAYRVDEPDRHHVAVLFNDITERRRTETALQELNATLEQRVAEEVEERARAEEAFRQSQKMEAVGQLTGGVAHDFNNLLTVLKSSTDLLRRPGLSDERRGRYLDAISETVDRAAKLTGQLLAFARRQALKPEVFDAVDRLRTVADMLDTVLGARIRVSLDLLEIPCHVRADASQFETALVNMAVNARDAMGGEGTLTLRILGDADLPPIRGHAGAAGPFAAVSLTDTGDGIPAEHLARIFEPFFTTKEVGKGTGLGLSQVFGFAKQSGGDVDVESEVGRGTSFTLYLPQVAGEPTQRSEGDTAGGAVAGGGGRRVLVVEDNVEIGRFATQILEDLGYRAEWASNAADALARLAEGAGDFDVVFSDVIMPGGMNGVDLAHAIGRLYPSLPVVLTSGYSHVLAEEGPQGFELVQKPYSAEQLSRALRQTMLLQRRRRG